MAPFSVYIATVLLAYANMSSAAPTAEAMTACKALAAKYSDAVVYNDHGFHLTANYNYNQATQRYWSMANADNVPACVFLPKSADMVAFAVSVLNTHTSVPWAVKGGGHNPNVGFSSTKGGILIAMELMTSTTLDASKIAHVQSGARWGAALTALEPYGVAIVGGRMGDVGVAGYTLGGGLSFLSTEYGLACDNVVNYEVVTAEGNVVQANEKSNTDLFYALKGGGGQFGIVTTYSFKSYPIGKVWGGTRLYTMHQKDALLAAVHNLSSNYYDVKAAVIVTADSTLYNLVDMFICFFFYNSPDGPGKILDEFLAVPHLWSTTKVQSYPALLEANSEYSLTGLRYLIRTETLPVLPGADGIDLLTYNLDSTITKATQFQRDNPLETFVFSTVYQPFPHQLANASRAAGGNVLNLDPTHGDRLWMEYDLSWLHESHDEIAAGYIGNITEGVVEHAKATYKGKKPTNYQSGDDVDWTNYNPIFMNDAMFNQRPLHRYGDVTFQKLKGIQQKRDPNGLFSKRTGGFKF